MLSYMGHSCKKIKNSARKFCDFLNAKGGREIERMLLSGKRLTVAELMRRYCVGRKSISRDFEVIGEELPVISKQGYNGGYFLMDGVGKNQNTLSQEQLECLEKVAVSCEAEDRETILSIIHEFGPYCGRLT